MDGAGRITVSLRRNIWECPSKLVQSTSCVVQIADDRTLVAREEPLRAGILLRKVAEMVSMTIDMPEGVFAALRKDPHEFADELRLAAAVKWYELRLVSQSRAAEIAGVPRSVFLAALGRFGVSPFQYDANEILEEAKRG